MNVVRIADAPAYQAPGHADMRMARLQGKEAGPSDLMWLGLSRIAPGGGTTLDVSDVEKLYMVVEGEVTISNGHDSVRLGPLDTCRIAAGEGRQLTNETDRDASILLAMPLPRGERTAGA